MTKEDAIKLIKLLSALESWSFSAKTDLPDYLHEDLSLALEKLEKIVLKDNLDNMSASNKRSLKEYP
jgi:hypothetical protein